MKSTDCKTWTLLNKILGDFLKFKFMSNIPQTQLAIFFYYNFFSPLFSMLHSHIDICISFRFFMPFLNISDENCWENCQNERKIEKEGVMFTFFLEAIQIFFSYWGTSLFSLHQFGMWRFSGNLLVVWFSFAFL